MKMHLEYPIILKNIDNQVAHKRLMNLGFDIRHMVLK